MFLLQAYLMNIPSWSLCNGDDVICLAELKVGNRQWNDGKGKGGRTVVVCTLDVERYGLFKIRMGELSKGAGEMNLLMVRTKRTKQILK